MKLLILLISLTLLISGCSADRETTIDNLFANYKGNIPGASLLIIKNGQKLIEFSSLTTWFWVSLQRVQEMKKNHCCVNFIFVICTIIGSLKNVKRMLLTPNETYKKGNSLCCRKLAAYPNLAFSNTFIYLIFKS